MNTNAGLRAPTNLEESSLRIARRIWGLVANSSRCQSCNDIGWYAVQHGEGDIEQVQCEWCYNVQSSLFNQLKGIDTLIKDEIKGECMSEEIYLCPDGHDCVVEYGFYSEPPNPNPYWVECIEPSCAYRSPRRYSRKEAIEIHNTLLFTFFAGGQKLEECPSCKGGCGGLEAWFYCPCCASFIRGGKHINGPTNALASLHLMLEEIANLSGLDNEVAKSSKHIVDRMARIHQIASSYE